MAQMCWEGWASYGGLGVLDLISLKMIIAMHPGRAKNVYSQRLEIDVECHVDVDYLGSPHFFLLVCNFNSNSDN